MNRKTRLAIDMDEVLADTIAKFITLYKQRHHIEISIEHKDGIEFRDMLPADIAHTLRLYINELGFFRDIPVMSGAQEVVKELNQKYDLFIVSAATEFKNSLIDKMDWLNDYFPFIEWTNIIFCGRKIVDVDIFIDDRIRNFADFNGRKLLYSSPHNHLITDYERVSSWKEVADKLL